ncbi:MAG: PGPGW domain-containing protein [Phycisphaerales bacterium JB052]
MPEINEQLIAILLGVSVVTFVGTLIIVPWILVRLPGDYFVREQRAPMELPIRHPVIRIILFSAKNLLGGVLLLGGIAMLVLPGQGLLTMLLGLSLLNFPGKFWLERKLVRRRAVHRSINWIRRKGGEGPIEVPTGV